MPRERNPQRAEKPTFPLDHSRLSFLLDATGKARPCFSRLRLRLRLQSVPPRAVAVAVAVPRSLFLQLKHQHTHIPSSLDGTDASFRPQNKSPNGSYSAQTSRPVRCVDSSSYNPSFLWRGTCFAWQFHPYHIAACSSAQHKHRQSLLLLHPTGALVPVPVAFSFPVQ